MTRAITLEESKEMLLDVENKDAERVAAAVGSTGASAARKTQKVATALLCKLVMIQIVVVERDLFHRANVVECIVSCHPHHPVIVTTIYR